MTTIKQKEILTILLIVLAGIYFALNKKTETESKRVTITGKITNPIGESVSFSNQDTSFSTTVTKNGDFTISFDLDSANYLRFEHGPEGTAMYVKPGDKINLTIDTELFDETIKYNGSIYSSLLAEKYLIEEGSDFYGKVYYMSSAEEYKNYLDSSYRNAFINELDKINDTVFINSEITNIDKNIEYFIGRQNQVADYSEDIKIYIWETREISREFNFYNAIDSLNSIDFNDMAKRYTEAFESSLNKVTDQKYILTAKENITKTTDSWIKRKTAVDNMPKEGEIAIDFTYPDVDGEEFSLASFRGNLIYVDVWATWCGPCKAEIPSLQKLEADYHEKNITFMSISVDTDKEAWEKMLAEKELGGVQLWADGWSKITKDYAIFGIPRFMLFDSKGDVLSTNAPRPSSDNIRELLDANL